MPGAIRCPAGVVANDDHPPEPLQPAPLQPEPLQAADLQMARTADAALDECVTLRALLDVTSGLIAVVSGEDHIFHFANNAWLTTIGSDVIGRPVRDVLPQAEARGLLTLLDSLHAGAPADGPAQRHTVAVVPAGRVTPVHIDFLCGPMTGLPGIQHGLVLEGFDVTDRVLAGERQQLIINELGHRVRNISATVLGLARLARGSTTDLDAFLASLSDRIVAMCKTQDLLAAGQSQSISVRDVLRLELEPYLDQSDDCVQMECADLTLEATSAVSLAMIVHELLTNALKYGALSAAGGRLRISCKAVGARALLTWSETTPHPIAPFVQRGFGSHLMERLARSLGDQLRFEPRPDGLDIATTFTVALPA